MLGCLLARLHLGRWFQIQRTTEMNKSFSINREEHFFFIFHVSSWILSNSLSLSGFPWLRQSSRSVTFFSISSMSRSSSEPGGVIIRACTNHDEGGSVPRVESSHRVEQNMGGVSTSSRVELCLEPQPSIFTESDLTNLRENYCIPDSILMRLEASSGRRKSRQSSIEVAKLLSSDVWLRVSVAPTSVHSALLICHQPGPSSPSTKWVGHTARSVVHLVEVQRERWESFLRRRAILYHSHYEAL